MMDLTDSIQEVSDSNEAHQEIVASVTDTPFAIAVQHHQQGRLVEAQSIYNSILSTEPSNYVVLNNLGLIVSYQGLDDEAEILYETAAALSDQYVNPLINLGNLFLSKKKTVEAISYYERALQIDPDARAAHVNLGNVFQAQGRLDEAVASYRRALAIDPDLIEAYLNLGNALIQLNRADEAIPQYERLLSLHPESAGAYTNMGVALMSLGELDRSKSSHEQALRIAPDNTDALLNLGTVFTALGQTDESVKCYLRILELNPDHPGAQSNLLSSLNYCDSITPEAVAGQCLRIGGMMEQRFLTARPHHRNDTDPDRQLRIGYVSPDFRRHAVSYFLEPLLCHDRNVVQIFCYAEIVAPDHITDRFRSFADHWLSTVGVGDDDLVRRIQEDGIDILIDLAGHTDRNRLPVFARRPAPIQMTWLGYPNTTGLKSIDYRLVDQITDPPGPIDRLASEILLRLDDCFLCYKPAGEAPPPMPPPSVDNGFVTFGSFNNLAKLSNASLHVWGRLLARIPTARLLLKSRFFAAEDSKARFLARLNEHGVAPERVILLGPTAETAGQLAAYHQVDIALDSFPYNGTTTTCESLWMGVPVVALAGKAHCGRVGMSLLTQTGLSELIARDEEDYITIAADLAGDPVRLTKLHQELRGRMAASPLCDAPGFARKLEAVYRTAWKRWCAAEKPAEETGTTATETFSLRLSDGSILALPPSLDAITTYVVLEQETWFEKEAGFPSLWLRPGMTAIDIGANLGVYSVPMARAVGPSGEVVAYEPAGVTASLLERSRGLNNAANLTIVRLALSDTSRDGHLVHGSSSELNTLSETSADERVSISCLDDEDRVRNWNSPDFVKIDTGGEEQRILRGGAGFFTRHSPLVMFASTGDVDTCASVKETLRSLGYHLYRLLAGAPVLVPDRGEAPDAYELNLFAAKPDRAAALARDGWLVKALPDWRPNDKARQNALDPLRQLACAAAFADLLNEGRPVDAAYLDCLAALAAWHSPDLRLPARCAALEYACTGLVTLNMGATTHARLLTLARASWEAGRRALCVQTLRHFLTELKRGKLHLTEPFWPPSLCFEPSTPAGTVEDWVIGSATEQLERSGHHSSLYTGSTPGVEWLCSHSFGSAQMERRRVLVRARAGQQTEVPRRLLKASAGHVNAAFWRALGVPNTITPRLPTPKVIVSQSPGSKPGTTNDPTNLVFEALSLLTPFDIDIAKRRIGPMTDGGYVFADRFSGSQAVLSYGIGTEYRFDVEMARAGHKVYMFDHTIDGIDATHPNLQWLREGVSGNRMPDDNMYTIADHLARCDIKGDRLILKMDVEGAEYEALGMISDEVLGRFEQIALEVHGLAHMGDPGFQQNFVRMAGNLNRQFTLFHVHGNNFDGPNGIQMVEGLPVTNWLELSYIKTAVVSRSKSRTLYPTAFDYPNVPRKDKLLWFFPFLPSHLETAEYRLCEERTEIQGRTAQALGSVPEPPPPAPVERPPGARAFRESRPNSGVKGRIVVDGYFFRFGGSGIARIWREVLTHWQNSGFGRRITVLNRGFVPSGLSGLEIVECPQLDYERWQDDHRIVQELCDKLDAALFISTYYTRPERTPSIQMVYDMIPERQGFDLSDAQWQQKHDAFNYASGYTAISANTRSDLIHYFPDVVKKPLIVNHLGVSPEFHRAGIADRQRFFQEFVLPKLGGRPYIMFLGGDLKYKNSDLLYEALSRIDCSGIALLLTVGANLVERFRQIPGLVVHATYLDEQNLQLQLAYSCADFLVYPSFYEGAGLPIIEAMACGCPVICANTSSLPEMAGEAALVIDPDRPGELLEAMSTLARPAFRQAMIERGVQHARGFRWEDTARRLEQLADVVIGDAAGPRHVARGAGPEPAEITAARQALAQGNLARAEVLSRTALEHNSDDPLSLRLLEEIGEKLGLRSSALVDGPATTEKRYVVIKPWGHGLWSDVDHALGQLLLAEITGRIPVTDWGSASRYARPDGQDVWRSLFEPVSDVEVDDLLPLAAEPGSVFPPKWAAENLKHSEINRLDGPWSRVSGLYLLARPERIVVGDFYTGIRTLSYWIPPNHKLHDKTTGELYRDLCRRYIRAIPEIAEEVGKFREQHFNGRRVVAVHVRGTDKVLELENLPEINAATPSETERLVTELNADVVFLLTDEAAIVEAFRSRFGDRLIHTGATRATGRVGLHFRADLQRATLAREVLVDVLLAAAADGFVGNGASNISAMVEHLKDWPTGHFVLLRPNVHLQHNRFLHPDGALPCRP